MEEHPKVGGDTAWVSGYGLYDELSPNMQRLLEGLRAVHTSRFQYDTTIVSETFLLWFLPCLILIWFHLHIVFALILSNTLQLAGGDAIAAIRAN
jgi:hypothetical protein